GQQGDACTDTAPCSPLLACKSGTCQSPDTAGSSCTASPNTCDLAAGGDFCIGAVCKKIVLAQAGETCGLDTVKATFTGCTSSAMCSGTPSGTCLKAAADGTACNSTTGPGCMPPAICDSGVCRLLDPAACK